MILLAVIILKAWGTKVKLLRSLSSLWLEHKISLRTNWKNTIPTLGRNLTSSFSRLGVKKMEFSGSLVLLIPLNKMKKLRNWTILLYLQYVQFSWLWSFLSFFGLRFLRLLPISKIEVPVLMALHLLSIWRGKSQICINLKYLALIFEYIFLRKRDRS